MEEEQRSSTPAAFRTRAIVLIPDVLSYCVVQSADHFEALQAEYPSPSTVLEAENDEAHQKAATPEDPCVLLWPLECEEHTQHLCDYHPFHLDFGPWTWMQCARLLESIMNVRARVLEHRRRGLQKVLHRRHRRGQLDRRRPLDDDEDTPSEGELDHDVVHTYMDEEDTAATGCSDHHAREDTAVMTLVPVRLYNGLDTATNIITSLGVMAVLSGAVRDARQVYDLFPQEGVLSWTIPFHDATPHDDAEAFFDLSALDVIVAALHAFQTWPTELRDTNRFVVAHEFFQRLEYGDVSWIVPWKIAAFASPAHAPNGEEDEEADAVSRSKPASYYADLFADPRGFYGCIGTVVQLNDNCVYDTAAFTSRGVGHETLFFVDGSTPSSHVMARFFDIMDQTNAASSSRRHPSGRARDAVALHCMAGLGRTGTLICLVLMRDYGFTAKGAIAWCRLCRPGCVIGPQQAFLCLTEIQWKRSLVEAAPAVNAFYAKGTITSESVVHPQEAAPDHRLHHEAPQPQRTAATHKPQQPNLQPSVVKPSVPPVASSSTPMELDRTSLVEVVINKIISTTSSAMSTPRHRDVAPPVSHQRNQPQTVMHQQALHAAVDRHGNSGQGGTATRNEDDAVSPPTTKPKPSAAPPVTTITYTVGRSISPSSNRHHHRRHGHVPSHVHNADVPHSVQTWLDEDAQRVRHLHTPPRTRHHQTTGNVNSSTAVHQRDINSRPPETVHFDSAPITVERDRIIAPPGKTPAQKQQQKQQQGGAVVSSTNSASSAVVSLHTIQRMKDAAAPHHQGIAAGHGRDEYSRTTSSSSSAAAFYRPQTLHHHVSVTL